MRFLLDLFYIAAAPFLIAGLIVPSRFFTRRRYRAGLREKLGGVSVRAGDRPCLWVHAVSVGEVRTALPLVKAVGEEFPDWEIVLSSSTDTGHDVAEQGVRALSSGAPSPLARVIYYPLDFSWAVRRSLGSIRPRAVLLIELELWPNFLLLSRQMDIPVLVANGRITERSARRYRRIGRPARALFSLPRAFAAQNETYAGRFRSLGVPEDRIEVLGNIKFDVPEMPTPPPRETLSQLGWSGTANEGDASDGGPVLMGGCTHPGEETLLLDSARKLRSRHGELKLILAPRHVERAADVLEEARRAAIGPVASWSDLRAAASGSAGACRVLVVDVIGELDRFYRIADLVVMGGTLTPHGGHNMLEPARVGKAVVLGPSVQNFEDVAGHLLRREAAVQVTGGDRLPGELERLLADRGALERLGRRARDASRELQGALGRHVDWLRRWLV